MVIYILKLLLHGVCVFHWLKKWFQQSELNSEWEYFSRDNWLLGYLVRCFSFLLFSFWESNLYYSECVLTFYQLITLTLTAKWLNKLSYLFTGKIIFVVVGLPLFVCVCVDFKKFIFFCFYQVFILLVIFLSSHKII